MTPNLTKITSSTVPRNWVVSIVNEDIFASREQLTGAPCKEQSARDT